MKINLIIPAKGTSQRIKNKNLCTINGKSLVRLACEKALRCSNVNEVYLDTESEEIISSVADLGAFSFCSTAGITSSGASSGATSTSPSAS